jgi:branched-chain amino acid aminotransferase
MKKQFFPYAFFQNKFVKTEEAKVSIMTNALQYGTGVIGGMRGYYNKNKKFLSIFRLDEHYERFLNSLKILGVSIPYSWERLRKITLELVKRNKPATDVYFRPFAYAGSTYLAPNLAQDKNFDFASYMIPLADYLPTEKGLSAMISSWRRISDNSIPARAKISGSYINSALARKEANDRGYDEAIVLNKDDHICEGSAENLFIVRDGVLITPQKSEDILEGITRRTVIELARDLKIPVEERTIDRTEIYIADEAFFVGTGVQLAWLAQVDGRTIGSGQRGKITGQIQDLFFKIVRGENKKYSPKWCTKVSI